MTQQWPGEGRGVAHTYAMWDAAYVLGSLSATERDEFERHLGGCPWCRSAVAELEGMPELLSHLDLDLLAALDADGDSDQMPAPPLPRRSRRTVALAWAGTAVAAAAVAVGVFVGVAGQSPAPPRVAAVPMVQVHTALLASTVAVSSQDWGTLIELRCVCLADSTAPHDLLAMVVVGRDGSRNRLASWVAHPGHTATPTGSTSIPVDQIASVQVVSADNDEVLLQRSL